MDASRLIVIDHDERAVVLARRLRMQGFAVELYTDAAEGANAALASPPDAVIADLWMPGISGVPLTRLLASEPATMGIPVILLASTDSPRNRFWARHAGAAAYVAKGRMGELLGALQRVTAPPRDEFFLQLGTQIDVRDRLAAHLDRALFESVLASEVRALGSVGTFGRLIDRASQLLVQVTEYRWMALLSGTGRLGLHCRPEASEQVMAEARGCLPLSGVTDLHLVEDFDAELGPTERPPLVARIRWANSAIGTLVVAPTDRSDADQSLVDLVAREFAGPLRMVELVEETRRLATTDMLTGLLRRAPFTERLLEGFLEGSSAVVMLDLDRFKSINDTFGHLGGDRALVVAARVMSTLAREVGGFAARWGGEEFVLSFPCDDEARALAVGQRLVERLRAEELTIDGRKVQLTGSVGVAVSSDGEEPERLVDRADRAMYAAKAAGRDRVLPAAAAVACA